MLKVVQLTNMCIPDEHVEKQTTLTTAATKTNINVQRSVNREVYYKDGCMFLNRRPTLMCLAEKKMYS